jgi:hypothetical protein
MIYTQYRENYGAHDWDGKGECPQYWKNKGGMEYFFQLTGVFLTEEISNVLPKLSAQLFRMSDYVEEYVVDWEVVSDDYLTPFEKDQLEYEGTIQHSPSQLCLK